MIEISLPMRTDSLSQYNIFDYYPNEELGDLNRLNAVLKQINYRPLLEKLNSERGNGRNDYPNQTMFFIFVAQFVFQKLNVNSMRRELAGNPTLRSLVGLSDLEAYSLGRSIVPGEYIFTRFYDRISQHMDMLTAIINELRDRVFNAIPEYSVDISGDGKYIDSFCPNRHNGQISETRRAEHDATYSIKEYTYVGNDGKTHTKKETHYGFRKHTLIDNYTELPIASILLPANEDERKAMKKVVSSLPEHILKRIRFASFDRGYDSTDFISFIRSHEILPIIDKRMLKKGNPLMQYKDTNVFYNDRGEVYYCTSQYAFNASQRNINQDTGYPECMVRTKFEWFDAKRNTLVYRFDNVTLRIDISENPRIFNEVARDSKKFANQYNKRTSVERYHSRLDMCIGFELHTIRGFNKMNLMVTMADIVLLAYALTHIELGQNNYASVFDFNFF